MSVPSSPRRTDATQDLRMLEVLLRCRVPDAVRDDPGTVQRVRDALRAGEEVADIMQCLPGGTDAIEAMLFARTAIDWWNHRLVVHGRVISTVA